MSDEPPPPSLRLRPRKRDDAPGPATPPAPPVPPIVESPAWTPFPAPAPVQPEPAAGITLPPPASPSLPETMPVTPPAPPLFMPGALGTPGPPAAQASPPEGPARFRLKPKLMAPAPADAVLEATPKPLGSGTVPAFTPPPVSIQDPAGIPRLKLRSLDQGAVADPGMPEPPSMPTPDPVAVGMSPPAFVPLPPLPSPSGQTMPPIMSIPQFVGGLRPVVVKPVVPSVPRPNAAPVIAGIPPIVGRHPVKHSRGKGLWVSLSAVGLIVGLGGGVYLFLRASEVPEPVLVRRAVIPAAPAAPVDGAPGKASSGGDSFARSGIAPLPPPPQPPPPLSDKPKTAAAKPVPAVASVAFRAWVQSVRITGVVGGESPRAIINGRLVRPGDIVDASAGVVFDALDMDEKQLVFRDQTGITLNKGY